MLHLRVESYIAVAQCLNHDSLLQFDRIADELSHDMSEESSWIVIKRPFPS